MPTFYSKAVNHTPHLPPTQPPYTTKQLVNALNSIGQKSDLLTHKLSNLNGYQVYVYTCQSCMSMTQSASQD